MNVLANVTFDMQRPGYAIIYAVQGDRLTRQVNAKLVNAGVPWTVPDGALMMIRYYKPDGTAGFYDTDESGNTAYTISGSSVTFTIAQQALAVVGNVAMQLNFYSSGGEALSSFPFVVSVQPSVYNDAEFVSTDYYNVLIGTLSNISAEVRAFQHAMEAGYNAPLKASTVASMTNQSKVYVYTGSENGYTAGHWYYWNGSAWTDGGVYNAVAINIDDQLSLTSPNPVENNVISSDLLPVKIDMYHNTGSDIGVRKNTFSFVTGAAHSSHDDQIIMNVPAGWSFTVDVNTSVSLSAVQIWAYYADNSQTAALVQFAGDSYSNAFTASKDIVAFGIYLDGSLPSCAVSFSVKIKGGLIDEFNSLKSETDSNLNSKVGVVNPANWLNLTAITDGECNANGTISASTTRFYTDYIPVTEGNKMQGYRTLSPISSVYRRHICLYDEYKNVITGGSDSSSDGKFTIPANAYFCRMTFDKNILGLNPVIVNDGTAPTGYTPYFAPYKVYTEDFLTPESKAAVQKVINKDLSTLDLANAYGCALPKGYVFRQTVGLPEKWYYANAVSPLTPVSIGIGSAYYQRENDAASFPNTIALNSVNGFTWRVYDMLLNLIGQDGQNIPYGMDRHIVAENLQNCSLLAIGDSTVDHDIMTQKMLDYFTGKGLTLTLLGTLGSGLNRNEGRAGWKAIDYLTNKQYDGVTNPFYNPNTGTFDFTYYMTNQGYTAPDFVVIQLGINDLYNGDISAIEPTWNAVKTMIDSIRAYNTSIKILLNLPTAPNSDQSVHSVFLPLYINRVVRYNQYAMEQALSLYGQSKVRPTYCHLILDPSTDISDNVHPTATGYEKMAKEIINQINCWQNNA